MILLAALGLDLLTGEPRNRWHPVAWIGRLLAFYLLFGLPGAWAYRVVNTADAMVGYREGILEYLGKPATRLDDLLNLVPARLAALALVLGSALAGALGVFLEKPGAYRLGNGNSPTCRDIGRSLRVLAAAAALVSVVAVAASGLSS